MGGRARGPRCGLPNALLLRMFSAMKGKVAILVLAVACIALGIILYLNKQRAAEDHRLAVSRIDSLSNDLVKTEGQLSRQIQVNNVLETNLDQRGRELAATSNRLLEVVANLAQTEAAAKAAAKEAQDEITRRDSKIAELEGRNDDLTKKMSDLNTSIAELETQIAETERKLAASEGDREFLLAELKRLQTEKADLEKQFNDLALLRDQIRKLRDELSIARRLEVIRRGLYGSEQKGSEKLQPGFATPPGQGPADLNVEIRQDGGARVVPTTNAPPPR